MRPSAPRVLLMCLALAFASFWLGCGPDTFEESEWTIPQRDDEGVVDSDADEAPCMLGEDLVE